MQSEQNNTNAMSQSIIKTLKKFIYGVIPYTFTKVFNPKSSKIKYYKYIKEHDYTRHVYDFAPSYINMRVKVMEDKEKELHYVLHEGNKKLYFPKDYSVEKIQNNYRNLIIEQHPEHPHHYIDTHTEIENKTILDIGAAEGIFSLSVIEKVNMVYLFECEPKWIRALEATFEPWKEKVIIIRKYISDTNSKNQQTLDTFFEDKPTDNLFLKMDIEGAECSALAGAGKLFTTATNLDFAICTYHRKNDVKEIAAFLDKYACTYHLREGYMYIKHHLRPGLLRGSKA